MMTRKILLLLAADHLHAWLWSGGKLSAVQSFANDPEGIAQFSAFMKGNRGTAYLLTDLSEEDYRLETLPALRGSDRRNLIQRKLAQLYRNTLFRQAILQQRRIDGRQEDAVLLTALTNPSLLSPWLDAMRDGQTALAGIYSIPTISAPLVADIPSRHLLLVSREKQGGLRQTYFDNKFLRFSRLTAIRHNHSYGGALAEEVELTRNYLHNQNLLPPDQALDVQVICHANERRELETYLASSAGLRYSCIDLQELGRRVKSAVDYADSDATPLFLHLLATRRYRNHYASPVHTHYFHLSLLRRSLHLSGAILAAGSLLWSTANILEGNRLIADTASIIASTQRLTQQAGQILPQSADPMVTANDMKTAVLLDRKLADHFLAPDSLLTELSLALNDFPQIQVTRLVWQTAVPPHATPPGIPETDVSNQDIMLSGELVKAGAGDLDVDAMEYLDGFRQTLIAQGFSVTGTGLPPNAESVSLDDQQRYTLKINRGAAP